MSKLKGQIDLEFMVSLSLFFIAVGYTFISITSIKPEFLYYMKKERLYSKVYSLSQLLINDPGDPINWENPATANRIGLMDERFNKTNLISKAKAQNFCTSYEVFVRKMDLKNNVSIVIRDLENTTNLNVECQPTTPVPLGLEAALRRIVAFNDTTGMRYAEFIIKMWEK